jgi:D-glycero-alpha-D-manno-heptose-7-phosphate kinase
MIISKTPLRISLGGGGTDLPSFYKNHQYGAVLSTTINKYIYVAVKSHSDIFGEYTRLNYSEVEKVQDHDKIKNPIIRECINFLNIDDRLFINTVADIPGSSGLGSSSSFCVGLLNALYKFKGESVSTGRLAEESAHIEIDILNRPIGKQDHYACAYGGLNYFEFKENETVTVQPIIPSNPKAYDILDSITAYWLKHSRNSADVLNEQNNKHKENAPLLYKMRDQAKEIRDFLSKEDISIRDFGKILRIGWDMKKQLASAISTKWIDDLYETALAAGAEGGKVAGAGGGGFLLVVSDPNKQKNVDRALRSMGYNGYKFQNETLGTRIIAID